MFQSLVRRSEDSHVKYLLHPASYVFIIQSRMNFEIISEITDIEPIAVSNDIRDIRRLRNAYGKGKWRKLKGIALIRLSSGRIRRAELHWYEASGIGRKEIKRKCYLD